MRGRRRSALAAALACLLAAACQSRPEPRADSLEVEPAADPLMARYALEQGRALLREGRSESAAHVLQRGLAKAPGDAALHRALARALEAHGLAGEAEAAWARADALDPPAAPLPDEPLPGSGAGLLVALVPAEATDAPGRTAAAWPEPEVEEILGERLALRLPRARVLRADPGSVGAARQWLAAQPAHAALSLGVERSWCGFTIKDGNLAVATLRVAPATTSGTASEPRNVMAAIEEPRLPGDCRREAVARALEQALALEEVRRVLSAPDARGEWSRESLRALFPGIARRLHEALRSGRALLAAGELAAAQRAFQAAAAIDPGDPEVRDSLADTQLTLELALELEARQGRTDSEVRLEPRLTPARRAAAEQALADERRRRDELLAALAVLDEDLAPPPAATLEALHRAEVTAEDAFGPRLARQRAGGEIELRVAYAPDGSELARYYVPSSGGAPLVREEDTDGDSQPDRWIAYRGGARSEIFEASPGRPPGLHFVFADGGAPLLSVEVDAGGDGRPDRVFRYEAGRLRAEELDSDGDGQLDRFDRFDAAGLVAERQEDLDGDGAIDVRSIYESGRLLRRVFSNERLAPES